MAEYARHKMNTSFDSYRGWCSDTLYTKIRDENRDDYATELALCKTPEEEKALLLREHERYLEIWQDRDEANFYSRQTETEKAQQTVKQQPAVPLRASGPQFGGCLVWGLIICCPPAWPFAIMALIFGGLSGRYRKPPSRNAW